MDVLVINSGSSSVKYKLFEMPGTSLLAAGRAENIGIGNSGKRGVMIQDAPASAQIQTEVPCTDHADAVYRIFDLFARVNPQRRSKPEGSILFGTGWCTAAPGFQSR